LDERTKLLPDDQCDRGREFVRAFLIRTFNPNCLPFPEFTMNIKRLTMSLLLASITGFTGVAMAGGGSRGGAYPNDSLATQGAAPMMGSAENGRMNMDACPMMSNGNCPMANQL
jgi:hypothetical protein